MNILSNNYLSRRPIDNAMEDFGKRFSQEQRVLDIGCGKKPYQKFFSCEYIGLDNEASLKPDIVANAWSIPVPDASFDGIILNQALEHIAQTEKTVAEVHRILKPGGYALITAPQTVKNHSEAYPSSHAPVSNFDKEVDPYWRIDYYRFTRFGLIYLFKKISNG